MSRLTITPICAQIPTVWTRYPYLNVAAQLPNHLDLNQPAGVDLGTTLDAKTMQTKYKFQKCKSNFKKTQNK